MSLIVALNCGGVRISLMFLTTASISTTVILYSANENSILNTLIAIIPTGSFLVIYL
ncbi:MAG: hypothetical protein KAW93_00425 [Methanogenium sp.]|nr:hypothetical protein [Methanogenium sp.]